MRNAEDLCSHAAAELTDFSNDQVGLPVLREPEQVGNHLFGVEACEELSNPEERSRRSVRGKRFELDLKLGIAFVGFIAVPIKARREHIESTALDIWVKRTRCRKADRMSVRSHGSRRGNERVEVTGAR